MILYLLFTEEFVQARKRIQEVIVIFQVLLLRVGPVVMSISSSALESFPSLSKRDSI